MGNFALILVGFNIVILVAAFVGVMVEVFR